MLNKSVLLVLACVSAAATAGDVYKWTDAGGVVHYSDTEPASEIKAQRLHLTETTTTEAAAPSADQTGDSAAAAPPAKPPEGALISSVQTAERRCEQARKNLEVLQSKGAVGFDAQGTGKAEVLDDQARQAQIARAQSLIANYCK